MPGVHEPTLVGVFRVALLDARRRVLRAVVDTQEELATLEPHQPGSFVQESAREETIAILARLGEHERHALDEIDAALTRLRTGTFGRCEACGQQIAFTRLRALPAARCCRGCQDERERPGSGAGRRAAER